jgi:hypothetical protein
VFVNRCRPGAARVLAASLLVWAVAAPHAGADPGRSRPPPPDWAAYRSQAGRFSVRLPEPPSEQTSARFTLGGRVHSAVYRVHLARAELRVEHHDMPRAALWLFSPDWMLDRALDDFLADEEGSDILAEAATRQGYPARELSYRTVDDGEPREGRALLVLVDRRLYVLASLRSPAISEAWLEPFFRSFQVAVP